jgi:TolA-binding protein
MQSKSSLFIFFCLPQLFFCTIDSFAQSKIFKTIQSGDYAKAKQLLQKELLKNPDDPVINYDAAWFYYQEDHQDFKPDSAWYHIVKCNVQLSKIKDEKQLSKFSSQGVRPSTVALLQNNIERRAYELAETANTVDGWEYFIGKFPGAKKHDDAVEKRNTLAFNAAKENFSYESFKDFMERYPNAAQLTEAKNLYENLLYKTLTQANTWKAFKDFIDKHPESPYADEARINYEKLLFEEFVLKNDTKSYAQFIKQFPENRFVPQAEDSLYKLFITDGSPENYYHFIQLYPKNKNLKDAWMKLYYLVTADFTHESLEHFEKNYPMFPYRNILTEEKKLCMLKLMSVESEDQIGYMDTVSKTLLFQGKFEEAMEFSGRYAAVLKDTLWGYIDRNGNMFIAPQFGEANEFINGFAVVGKGNCEEGDCLYGFIDQSGKTMLPFEFEEVYDMTQEGLALVKQAEK